MSGIELLVYVFLCLSCALMLWHALGVMIRTHHTVGQEDGLLVEPVPESAWHGLYQSRLWREDEWARANGFQRAGACVFMDRLGVFWQRDEGHEMLLARFCESGVVHERITIIDSATSITSSDRDELLAMPRPPRRIFEARRYHSLDQLEAGHLLLVQTQVAQRRWIPGQLPLTTIGLFQHMLNERIEHVRAIPFYPLRAVLWSFAALSSTPRPAE
ncbi:MAG: hypothetical protein KDK91_15560 [Gammaproteobacteria bacterium]|nr:hypothetical protein [Gammaproteobacteria bacterium]